jgi:WhiB family redox-sensing transcriptional regulator
MSASRRPRRPPEDLRRISVLVAAHVPDPDWDARSACRDHDPELWYPARGDASAAEKAWRVCFRCPVRLSCLHRAVVSGEREGIWGGLTYRQRALVERGMPSPQNMAESA